MKEINLKDIELETIFLTVLGVLGLIALIFVIIGLILLANFISNIS